MARSQVSTSSRHQRGEARRPPPPRPRCRAGRAAPSHPAGPRPAATSRGATPRSRRAGQALHPRAFEDRGQKAAVGSGRRSQGPSRPDEARHHIDGLSVGRRSASRCSSDPPDPVPGDQVGAPRPRPPAPVGLAPQEPHQELGRVGRRRRNPGVAPRWRPAGPLPAAPGPRRRPPPGSQRPERPEAARTAPPAQPGAQRLDLACRDGSAALAAAFPCHDHSVAHPAARSKPTEPIRHGSYPQVRRSALRLGPSYAGAAVRTRAPPWSPPTTPSPAVTPRCPCRRPTTSTAARCTPPVAGWRPGRRLRHGLLLGGRAGVLADPRRVSPPLSATPAGTPPTRPTARCAPAARATPRSCWWSSTRRGQLRAAPAGVLGGPRPHPGHAPGQRCGHPVPLGGLRLRTTPRPRRWPPRSMPTSRCSPLPATPASPPRSPRAGTFWYAEADHQQYLSKHPGGYCGLGGTGVSCPIGLTGSG